MLSRMLTNYLVLLFLPISLRVAPLIYMGGKGENVSL